MRGRLRYRMELRDGDVRLELRPQGMDDAELDACCVMLSKIVHVGTVRHSIVVLLADGKSRKEIACSIERSQHTVDEHLKDIYRRTGLRDRVLLAAAVRRVFRPPLNWGVDTINATRILQKDLFAARICQDVVSGARVEATNSAK